MEAGVARGPKVGALLKEVETWWIDGDFRATRAEALAQLRRLAAGRPKTQPRPKKPG